jgi:hypothetical protein
VLGALTGMRGWGSQSGQGQRVDFEGTGDCMRALICDLRTGRFYGPDGRWTPRRDEACDFRSADEASAFAVDNLLLGVAVVLASDNAEQDRTVSVEFEGRQPRVL